MSGKVKELVPYFVPGEGETVNESLSHYRDNKNPKSQTSHMSINVRKWDHAEGFFKDAAHIIHDHDLHSTSRSHLSASISPSPGPSPSPSPPPSPSPSPSPLPSPLPSTKSLRASIPTSLPSPSSPPSSSSPFVSSIVTSSQPDTQSSANTPRLLTPAEIRQARRKALSVTPVPYQQTSKSPHAIDVTHTSPNPSSSQSSLQQTLTPNLPIHSTQTNQKTPTSSSKPRPFAGSTFETASPPPAGLPIPGFVKSRVRVDVHREPTHGREQAAVDLKRILRI